MLAVRLFQSACQLEGGDVPTAAAVEAGDRHSGEALASSMTSANRPDGVGKQHRGIAPRLFDIPVGS